MLNMVHWSRYALAEVRIGRGGRGEFCLVQKDCLEDATGAVLSGAGESLCDLCYTKNYEQY